MGKKQIKKRKPSPSAIRKRAVNAADKWFSLYIRARDGWRSVTSGSTTNLTCSHLFSRRFYATRWDEENAYCQTAGENLYHNRDPGPLTAHYLKIHTAEEYQELYQRARSGVKLTTDQIVEVGTYFKMRYHRIHENDFFNVM